MWPKQSTYLDNVTHRLDFQVEKMVYIHTHTNQPFDKELNRKKKGKFTWLEWCACIGMKKK